MYYCPRQLFFQILLMANSLSPEVLLNLKKKKLSATSEAFKRSQSKQEIHLCKILKTQNCNEQSKVGNTLLVNYSAKLLMWLFYEFWFMRNGKYCGSRLKKSWFNKILLRVCIECSPEPNAMTATQQNIFFPFLTSLKEKHRGKESKKSH